MKRVLFVCTGNVCRSPMATGLLRHRLQELGLADRVSAASAGVYALVGQPASANAVTALAQRGIDISNHVAHSLEIADVKAADIVLVMEEAHRRSIFYNTPQHLGKAFLLTEMSGQHHDVKDPYGQPLPEYERCAQELTQLIDQGMPQILRRLGLAARS